MSREGGNHTDAGLEPSVCWQCTVLYCTVKYLYCTLSLCPWSQLERALRSQRLGAVPARECRAGTSASSPVLYCTVLHCTVSTVHSGLSGITLRQSGEVKDWEQCQCGDTEVGAGGSAKEAERLLREAGDTHTCPQERSQDSCHGHTAGK